MDVGGSDMGSKCRHGLPGTDGGEMGWFSPSQSLLFSCMSVTERGHSQLGKQKAMPTREPAVSSCKSTRESLCHSLPPSLQLLRSAKCPRYSVWGPTMPALNGNTVGWQPAVLD